MSPIEELLSLIDSFLSGTNRSKRLAEEIEGLVLECFADEPWFDEVSLALAQYAPGEGSNYLSERDLATELASVAKALRNPPEEDRTP
jgi:hypothetical protein